ncbi:LysE family translocator [Thaumasiovibrio sp. DFM-14]|uniref:LysE family translocator n=1 Tax=Thaumasiovibrio sp. DFM-14 TaxID=3384792 RepID=UPI0039A1FB01
MELNLWIAYVSVISLLIFTPGPSAILCLNHGVKFGAVSSIPTILGGSVASLLLMALSAFGLGVLLLASANAFLVVKLAGAAYLVYLGIGLLREGSMGVSFSESSISGQVSNDWEKIKTGFLVGISNPKDIIFFAALFPNFINLGSPQAVQFIILALTWSVIDFATMFAYSSLGLKVAPWFEHKTNMLRFNRTLGGFFVTAGSLLAVSSK